MDAEVRLDASQVPPFGAGLLDELTWNHVTTWWQVGGRELGDGAGFDEYWADVRDSFAAVGDRTLWLNLLSLKVLAQLLASGQVQLTGDRPATDQLLDAAVWIRAGLLEVATTALTNLAEITPDARVDGRLEPVAVTLPEATTPTT